MICIKKETVKKSQSINAFLRNLKKGEVFTWGAACTPYMKSGDGAVCLEDGTYKSEGEIINLAAANIRSGPMLKAKGVFEWEIDYES
jgi:hypothetical protein